MAGVFALDLAGSTGWAFYKPGDERPLYGLKRLSGGSEEAKGLDFLQWFDAKVALLKPDRIAFEAPFVKNANTAERLFGLAYLVRIWAHRRDRTAYAVTPSEWRKHFLGRGGGKRADLKAASIEACRLRGWEPQSDDVADALGLLDYACQLWGIDVPWPKSAIEAAEAKARAA